MCDTKSFPPPNHCNSIRDLYYRQQSQRDRIVERREALGAAIDQLRRQFTSETDESERQRLSEELNTTIDLFQSLNAEFLRLEQNLEDYKNDYEISGCPLILGDI